jgi:hypothetical protein
MQRSLFQEFVACSFFLGGAMSADGVGQVPTTGTTGQVPADGTPQGANSQGQQSGTAEPRGTFDAEYVKALRDEAAKHRTEKAAVEAELKKLRDAQLTERRCIGIDKLALRSLR